jgi:hypothetical protein
MGAGGSGRKGAGRTQDTLVHRSFSEGGGRRTQGKPEGEMGGVGEREKEGRKTHLSTVA